LGHSSLAAPELERFSGKIRKRTLTRGPYRASLTATDAAGNRSKTKRLNLKVVG